MKINIGLVLSFWRSTDYLWCVVSSNPNCNSSDNGDGVHDEIELSSAKRRMSRRRRRISSDSDGDNNTGIQPPMSAKGKLFKASEWIAFCYF